MGIHLQSSENEKPSQLSTVVGAIREVRQGAVASTNTTRTASSRSMGGVSVLGAAALANVKIAHSVPS